MDKINKNKLVNITVAVDITTLCKITATIPYYANYTVN